MVTYDSLLGGCHTSKRGITLDIAGREGRELFKRLAQL